MENINDFFNDKKEDKMISKKEREEAIKRLHNRLSLPLGVVFSKNKASKNEKAKEEPTER